MNVRLASGFVLLLAACLTPRQPAEPRYFSPASAPVSSELASSAPRVGPELRLRRVTAADYLRRRMVWRRGVEVGFYDLLRWTQPPASYVETRLGQELFERRGLRRVTRPDSPSLTVALRAAHASAVALAERSFDGFTDLGDRL